MNSIQQSDPRWFRICFKTELPYIGEDAMRCDPRVTDALEALRQALLAMAGASAEEEETP